MPGETDDGSVPSVDEAAVNTPGHLQLTLHPDAAGGDSLAGGVGGLAHVGSRVFRVSVEDVQSDEAKVIGRAETMTCGRKRWSVKVCYMSGNNVTGGVRSACALVYCKVMVWW